MPKKRSYAAHGDACAGAHGIELVGEVWTYPIVREMFLGPKRFSELRHHIYEQIQLAKEGIVPAQVAGGDTAEDIERKKAKA